MTPFEVPHAPHPRAPWSIFPFGPGKPPATNPFAPRRDPLNVLRHTTPPRPYWQRVQALTVLRSLALEAPLMYCLFRAYDMSIHRDMNAVHDTVRATVEILKVRGGAWERAGGNAGDRARG